MLKERSPERRCLASMGIYVFNRAVLAEALENSMTDFGREVIPGLLGRKKLFAHIFEGYWEDIGTVRAFFEANLALAQPLPPFNFFDASVPVYTHYEYLPASKLNKVAVDNVVVADGCIVTDSRLKHSLIGIRSYIGEGSDLEDVIVMGADYYETAEQIAANVARGKPHLGIGRNCRIRRAIIDKNTRIGDGSTLSPEGKPDGAYAGGTVVVRDGILVVPKGALIPPGTVV
jgi:glucose-1-phosphate adenylyltransferase